MQRERLFPAAAAGALFVAVALLLAATRERRPDAAPLEARSQAPPARDAGAGQRDRGAAGATARVPLLAPTPEPRIGLWVGGRVTDPDGLPVPGATVELRLGVGRSTTLALATAATDGDGGYETAFGAWPELPEATRASLSLAARATAPLFSEWRWREARLGSAASQHVRIDLRLKRGAALSGRVMLADGSPCEGAIVTPRPLGEARAPSRRTDAHGRYLVPVIDSGRFELRAMHPAFGRAAPLPIRLDTDRDLCLPDLVILPAARIAGRVTYPDGSPAGGLALEAQREPDLPDEAGLTHGRVETDVDGRFVFAGLTAGEYRIRCPSNGAELAGSRERYATDSTCAELTLRHYRLKVRAVDARGRGVPGATFRCSYALDGGLVASTSRTITSTDGLAHIDLSWLEPPREYEYELTTPLTPPVRGRCTIVEGQYETALELVVGPVSSHSPER